MNITLAKYSSQSELSITQYLLKENSVSIAFEHERDEFERVVGDVRITASNQTGFFTTQFANQTPDTRWIIRIFSDERQIFVGEIDNPSIVFNANEETVSFDVFSQEKIFWDRAKITPINQNFTTVDIGLNRVFLSYMIDFNIQMPVFSDITRGVLMIDKYYDSKYSHNYNMRYVRWVKYRDQFAILHSDTDNILLLNANHGLQDNDRVMIVGHTGSIPDINGVHKVVLHNGNWIKIDIDITQGGTGGYLTKLPIEDFTGRYADLDPTMTVEELLKAVEIYYNAEFILDYNTKFLMMKKRGLPISSTAKDISSIICEDEPAEFYPFGEPRYDYIYTTYAFVEIPPLEYLGMTFPTNIESNLTPFPNPDLYTSREIKYYLTATINDIESNPSEVLNIMIPPSIAIKDVSGGIIGYRGYKVQLRIPQCISGTSKRTIYRNELYGNANGKICKMLGIDGNEVVEIEDGYRCDTAIPLPSNSKIIVNAWAGFDEKTGQWLPPIYDTQNGKNRPIGKRIFEILPSLRFVDPNTRTQLHSTTSYDIYCFFGKDNSFENIREEWIDLMITKSKLILKVIGTDFVDGDEIIRPKIKNLGIIPVNAGTFVVKRAEPDLFRNETRMEIVQK